MILVAMQKRKYFVIGYFLDSCLFFRRVVIVKNQLSVVAVGRQQVTKRVIFHFKF